MSIETVTQKITQKLSRAAGIKARVKFDFGDDGVIFVDGTADPVQISTQDAEADTTLRCSLATFEAILDGTKDPNIAFLMGQLKVQGSMGLAMKLNAILED